MSKSASSKPANPRAIDYRPGHMAKALRELYELSSKVDFAVEVVDARAPELTHNAKLMKMFANVSVLTVAVKSDLSSDARVGFDTNAPHGRTALKKALRDHLTLLADRQRATGIVNPSLVGVVVGMPNVGKSSVINALLGRRSASAQDRPGVTRSQQLFKVAPNAKIFDTPGVLPPVAQTEDQKRVLRLLNVLPADGEEMRDALGWLFAAEPSVAAAMQTRAEAKVADFASLVDAYGRRMGIVGKGGAVDADRCVGRLFGELREGKFGSLRFRP